MNKFELSMAAFRLPIDFLMVVLAGVISYNLRTSDTVRALRPILYTFDTSEYRFLVLAFAMIVVITMAFGGLYVMKITRGILSEWYSILNAVSTSILIIILYYFFVARDIFSSRFLFVSLWIFSVILLGISRLMIRFLQVWLLQKYRLGIHKIILVLGDPAGDILFRAFQKNPGMGYEVVHSTDRFQEKQFLEWINQSDIDEVILTNSHISPEEQMRINDFCDEHKLDFQYIPNLFDTYGKVDVRTVAGVMLFRVRRTTLEGWGSILKRLFDIFFAIFFIFVFSPVYLLIALLIKLDSRGPILYASTRVGPRNQRFPVYKFRSMYVDMCTDESDPKSIAMEQKLLKKLGTKTGPVNKIKDDPRVTRVGKFIRKTSLDELPQFFNVLLGSMSVVGPRPHQPREVQAYQKHHKKVLTIKPGITGMAQVNGRSDLSFDEEVLYDTFYIENWSLILDLLIILKTPLAVIAPRKAD